MSSNKSDKALGIVVAVLFLGLFLGLSLREHKIREAEAVAKTQYSRYELIKLTRVGVLALESGTILKYNGRPSMMVVNSAQKYVTVKVSGESGSKYFNLLENPKLWEGIEKILPPPPLDKIDPYTRELRSMYLE